MLVPSHHTRACFEDWALLLCVRQVTSHSPVAWSAGTRHAAELATLLCLVVAVTQSCHSLCSSCGVRKWQKPGCALPQVLVSLALTHTFLLLSLTGGCCLCPLLGSPRCKQQGRVWL